MSQEQYVAEELLDGARDKFMVNDKDYQALRQVVETSVKAAEWIVWPIDPEHSEWGCISFKEFPSFEFWPYTYACPEHLAATIAHHGTEAHVKHVSWEPTTDLPCVWCANHPKETDERDK